MSFNSLDSYVVKTQDLQLTSPIPNWKQLPNALIWQGADGTVQELNLKRLRTYLMSDITMKWKCSGAQSKKSVEVSALPTSRCSGQL